MVAPTDSVRVAYYRGGTSKALFFHEDDIPSPGPRRDTFLRRVMGSPDPMQIDGMGGTHIVTSKVAIVRPSDRADADVDYTFAQIGITTNDVGYAGNCGNISAAVGPFALHEGLVKTTRNGAGIDPKIKTREVRIYNTGTKKILVSHVPVDRSSGVPLEAGDFTIAGCPGSGAPILMDYKDVVGATLGASMLPTGNAIDSLIVEDKRVNFTICDVGNIIVFAQASDLGMSGSEDPHELDKNRDIISRVRELRGKAAQMVGMCKDWSKVDQQSPMIPMVALISRPTDAEAQLQSRLFLDNKCHTSMAGTGAICTTACSQVEGSVVNKLLTREVARRKIFNIQHPLGIIPISVETTSESGGDNELPVFKNLSFIRTARRILNGQVYIPEDIRDEVLDTDSVNTGSHTNGDQSILANGKVDATLSNGHDHENRVGDEEGSAKETSITGKFAQFVESWQFKGLEDACIVKLQQLLLDYVGVGAAATKLSESSTPFYQGVDALMGHHNGRATVFGRGSSFTAPYAALLNAALAHSLDFDDTHASAVLHPGVTVISAALAQAETDPDTPSTALLAAMAVGYEVVCRLGKALGNGGYKLGFHNTSTAGIFGAIAAISRLKGLNSNTIESAFGLAISKTGGSMQYLKNGSWNKRLHPGFAAHDAFICVALAEAGVLGAAEPIEGEFGLLNVYSSDSDRAGLTDQLGSRWEFLETAIKPYPACRMTHGQIELASQMAKSKPAETVKSITVYMAKVCYPVVGASTPNKIHPKNTVDAQFSSYFQTAVSWLYGLDQGWDLYTKLHDPTVQSLCEKISVEVDERYQGLKTSLSVVWEDGQESHETLDAPSGEKDNPLSWDDLQRKFLSNATPAYGEIVAAKICTVVQRLQRVKVHELTDLLK